MRFMPSLKMFVVYIGLTLGTTYVFFSYVQFSKSLQNENKILFLKTKKDITRALEQLQHYLNLTESRLLNSLHNEDVIPQILSLRGEHLIKDRRFPEIMSITFTPASDPMTSYSRYGKRALKPATPTEKEENDVLYLGEGMFKVRKILYDKNEKSFGTLHITFSIENALYKYFSENEISLLSNKQHNFRDNLFAFNLLNLPYVFVLNKTPLSFKEFLVDFKWQIFSALAFGIALLLGGIAVGTFFKHKILISYRALNQQLKEALRISKDEKAAFSTQSLMSQNILRLKDQAKKELIFISNSLLARYHQMATQAQSTTILTSKLIAEEADNNKSLKEIHAASKESTKALGQLIKGYPNTEVEESIPVLQSIENIKKIFLPEIIERNIILEIKGKVKTLPYIDKLTFEIVLHNIFHMIMSRLGQNNLFKINLKESNSLEIIFHDNGYDIEPKPYKLKNIHDYEDILRLTISGLRDFTNYLGWEISFQKENSLNSVRLFIPQAFQENFLTSNVVNLVDFRPSHI